MLLDLILRFHLVPNASICSVSADSDYVDVDCVLFGVSYQLADVNDVCIYIAQCCLVSADSDGFLKTRLYLSMSLSNIDAEKKLWFCRGWFFRVAIRNNAEEKNEVCSERSI